MASVRCNLDPGEFVVGTFEPVDLEYRLDSGVIAYLEENGLVDEVILDVVSMMRDWYDDASGDAARTFLNGVLARHVGKEKLEELTSS